jgi:uncharacterized sulfatase
MTYFPEASESKDTADHVQGTSGHVDIAESDEGTYLGGGLIFKQNEINQIWNMRGKSQTNEGLYPGSLGAEMLFKPNILLLVIDSLRYDHVSYYGYGRKTTPNVDEVCSRSLVFDEAISPSGWTPPVFSSILTGTYPSKNGAGAYVPALPTMIDILRSCGYATFGVTISYFLAAISRGYDEFTYLDRTSARRLILSRDRRAVAEFAALVLKRGSFRNIETLGTGFLLNRLTKQWIGKHHNQGPFLALVHYSAHWPYEPPQPFFSQFLDEPLRQHVADVKRDVYDLISQGDLKPKLKVIEALYDGQIAWADACVGDLLRYIESIGLSDNTLTIITSDHGDLLGEHGLLFHEFVLYEPLIHVPFLMMFPDMYHTGKRYSGLVQTLDILPTIIDYLGLEPSNLVKDIQGKSLLKLVEHRDSRDFTISERSDWQPGGLKARKLDYLEQTYPHFDWRQYEQELRALRTKEFKYIWSSRTKGELYNLTSDPGESRNLIAVERNNSLELRNKMEQWGSSFIPAKQSTLEAELDRFVKDKLRKLGYL